MGASTEIAWTDSTFNPWWGCQRVSPGCENCYAETFDKRVGRADWGPGSLHRFFGDKHWNEPIKWNREAQAAGVRRRVFCASMADVFEDRRDLDEHRDRLWRLIAATPMLDWLLLTKRPENLAPMLPWRSPGAAPWGNVWIGTTVEDQKRADLRLPLLRLVPAIVRFVSFEPLLGPVSVDLAGLHWAIIGGESGHRARPFDLDWARSLLVQARVAGCAPFVKQMGDASVWPLAEGALHSLRAGRVRLKPKGGDPAEWPADLRVREFPR